jgi:hypothetical protein
MVDFEWLSLSLNSEEGSWSGLVTPAETFEDLSDLQNVSDGVMLVPKLQLGKPDCEALASRDRKLELPVPNSEAGRGL